MSTDQDRVERERQQWENTSYPSVLVYLLAIIVILSSIAASFVHDFDA
jgi:hypothetical protein